MRFALDSVRSFLSGLSVLQTKSGLKKLGNASAGQRSLFPCRREEAMLLFNLRNQPKNFFIFKARRPTLAGFQPRQAMPCLEFYQTNPLTYLFSIEIAPPTRHDRAANSSGTRLSVLRLFVRQLPFPNSAESMEFDRSRLPDEGRIKHRLIS
jgi:hypothetical protein